MAFPTGWPPRSASGHRSFRVLIKGTTTPSFSGNAYLYIDQPGANTVEPTPYVAPGSTDPVQFGDLSKGGTPMGGGQRPVVPGIPPAPKPMIHTQTMRIAHDGGTGEDLEFSFDGILPHGYVRGVTSNEAAQVYRNRYEAGIALRIGGDLAEGDITTIEAALINDGEVFVLNDGANPAVTFEFDKDGSVVETDTLRQVDLSGGGDADAVRDLIIAAINSAPVLEITASNGGAATVDLVGLPGTAANNAITDTVLNVGFTHTGMAGATGVPVNFIVEAW